ncbi:MAG: hypothetical protein RMI99_06840 [Nitrososphaerota archaeon]|nr:hypothetical protein [Nitrososphaerota archaeon]
MRGVSSSLALLASVMVLMAQISVNIAFIEILDEEVLRRLDDRAHKVEGLAMVLASDGSSLVVVNGHGRELFVTDLILYHVNGSALSLQVPLNIPPNSVLKYDVGLQLAGYIAALIEVEGYGQFFIPVNRF